MLRTEPFQAMASFDRLSAYIDAVWPDLAGFDPYDALNSPMLRRFAGTSPFRRLVCLQLLRRCPFEIRPFLGVESHVNPKTVSLMARALLQSSPDRARGYLEWLEEHATPGYSGACWGYTFPWQSRRLWLARGSPSSVCTAFVATAFLDAYAAWGEPRHLAVAQSSAEFLLRDCPRDKGCISYLPGRLLLVHNASLLAAATLARVWRASRTAQDELREAAVQAAAFTLADQRPDGAWTYDASTDARHAFIDGFHTGLVLEALDDVAEALDLDYSEAICRGLSFYRGRMVCADGRPRRRFGDTAPTDVRDCAEALLVLTRFGHLPQRDAVLNWTLANMRDTRGYFIYEYGGGLSRFNRTPFPRWQAWMLLALSRL